MPPISMIPVFMPVILPYVVYFPCPVAVQPGFTLSAAVDDRKKCPVGFVDDSGLHPRGIS